MKEVIFDLEFSKYQMVEWCIFIYGRMIDEWDKLVVWVVDNKLFFYNVCWLIQVLCLFDVYKGSGFMDIFEQIVINIFQFFFEVMKDLSFYFKFYIFFQCVIGFDSVDDESKIERWFFKKFLVLKVWIMRQNFFYSYWIYYLYVNMVLFNYWWKKCGFNIFVFCLYCGEVGDSEYLVVVVFCCYSISYGLLFCKVLLFQYIFYFDQIGMVMLLLSNNVLFLVYEWNFFHMYFKCGFNVFLLMDDFFQFVFIKELFIEEYVVVVQIYKFSFVDMCEFVKNLVKQSGYEKFIKS